MIAEITLISRINATEDEKTKVLAEIESITQKEFSTAGEKGIKPAFKIVMWRHEYNNETELEHNGQHLTVYRTYDRITENKIELYTEKRVGRR